MKPLQPYPCALPGPPSSFHNCLPSQLSNFGAPPYTHGSVPIVSSVYSPPGRTLPAASDRQQPRYAPPPGPPSPEPPLVASTSNSAGLIAPPASRVFRTSTPPLVHLLLRNGRTLVYPETDFFHQCKPRFPPPSLLSLFTSSSPTHCALPFARTFIGSSTGYKIMNPLRSCRKCKDRLGKLFLPILTSNPREKQGSGAMIRIQYSPAFQRLLSAIKPPQAGTVPVHQPTLLHPPPPPPLPSMFVPPSHTTNAPWPSSPALW